MVKEIKLTNCDKVTIVDDDDYELYGHKRWVINWCGYAMRLDPREGRSPHRGAPRRNKTTFLHRTINKTPEGLLTDHINKNKLDNRKENLRSVTPSENALNRKLEAINKSGYRCVHKITYPKTNYIRWRARATINKKMYSLGCFITPEEAHEAYIKFMKEQGVFMYEEN